MIRLRARPSGFRFTAGVRDFFFLIPLVQTGPGTHPASYSMGTRGSFHGVKRPRREAEHSPPVNAEVVAKIID